MAKTIYTGEQPTDISMDTHDQIKVVPPEFCDKMFLVGSFDNLFDPIAEIFSIKSGGVPTHIHFYKPHLSKKIPVPGTVVTMSSNPDEDEHGSKALPKPNRDKPAFKVFPEVLKTIDRGACPICKSVINERDFRDDLSRKEFSISGMCQKCQDRVFGA